MPNKLVDAVLYLLSKMPSIALHNLEKARTLKLIFWQLAVDGRKGDYIEFGVAQGNSLRAAILGNNSAAARIIGVNRIDRRFIGFDTFSSFSTDSSLDSHEVWQGTKFNHSLKMVQRRFRHNSSVELVAVDVLKINDDERHTPEKLGISDHPAVILFDMDLYAPTAAALLWCERIINQGTFLVFDESFSFNGSTQKGEALAIREFCLRNPSLSLRPWTTYGSGGIVYIVDINP
jgi:O-methyltransferase